MMSIKNHRGFNLISCLFTSLSTYSYSILVLNAVGDEVVSIATTQELGVGVLELTLGEKKMVCIR